MSSSFWPVSPTIHEEDSNEDTIEMVQDVEKYPKQILPIIKDVQHRSRRPLLSIHVKITGETENYLNSDAKTGNLDGSYRTSNPPSDYSRISPILSSPATSLSERFSQLEMMDAPPKPETAAQFAQTWKQIKSCPQLFAHYLHQFQKDDYIMFGNCMEYCILADILNVLVWEFIPREWDITSHMVGLTEVGRFSTLLLFSTEKDRANIRMLISKCPHEMREGLKRKYDV